MSQGVCVVGKGTLCKYTNQKANQDWMGGIGVFASVTLLHTAEFAGHHALQRVNLKGSRIPLCLLLIDLLAC